MSARGGRGERANGKKKKESYRFVFRLVFRPLSSARISRPTPPVERTQFRFAIPATGKTFQSALGAALSRGKEGFWKKMEMQKKKGKSPRFACFHLPGTSTLSPVELLHVSSPLWVNFANPETSEEGATSLEAGVGGGDGVVSDEFDGVAVLLELNSAVPLPLALPSAAAAAAAEGLRMLASGAMPFVSPTRVSDKKNGRERVGGRSTRSLSKFFLF